MIFFPDPTFICNPTFIRDKRVLFFNESVSYAYNLVFLFIPWIFSIWTKCCLISYCAMQIVKLKLTWSERSLRCSFPKLYQVTLNTRWFRYTRKFQSWRHKAAFPRRRHLRQFTVQCRLSERRFARWFTVESGLKAQIKAHGRRTCSWFFLLLITYYYYLGSQLHQQQQQIFSWFYWDWEEHFSYPVVGGPITTTLIYQLK